jgi:hypothetical protein
MAMILEFRTRSQDGGGTRGSKRAAAARAADPRDAEGWNDAADDAGRDAGHASWGEIVLFTGVRYSRHEDAPSPDQFALSPGEETART